MTRNELYRLVWDRPMAQVAQGLGVSSAGLRKMCLQHDIPIPPAGYWTKVAYGKADGPPVLPSASSSLLAKVNGALRRLGRVPLEIAEAQIGDYDIRFGDDASVVVPAPSEVLHPSLLTLRQQLADQAPDQDGFIAVDDPALPSVKLGAASVPRALLLLDALFVVLARSGAIIRQTEDGLRCVMDDEYFAIKIYETRDKNLNIPAIADTERAMGDRPTLRPGWTYRPSGKLALAVSDTRPFRWSAKNAVGYWYDREGRPIEKCVGDVVARMAEASELIKRSRSRHAGQQNALGERFHRIGREAAAAGTRSRRRQYVVEKARSYSEYVDLVRLQSYLQSQPTGPEHQFVDRLKHELSALIAELADSFAPDALNADIAKSGMFSEGQRD